MVIPHLDEKVDFRQNIIYTLAFRAAWTLLKEDIIGEDIKLAIPVGLEHRLNGLPYRPAPGNERMVRAGFVSDGVIDRIEKEVKDRFGDDARSLNPFRGEDDAIVCYARFRKEATFIHTFETLEWDFVSAERPLSVACFGISRNTGEEDKRALRSQVSIFDYRNPDDFIVRLATAEPGQEIILAKTEPERTLLATILQVDRRINASLAGSISDMDELVIPKLVLSTEHVYDELIGKFLVNKGFEEYFFAKAREQTTFTMDESGVVAEATGEIVIHKGPRSRTYAFDKPFQVMFGNSPRAYMGDYETLRSDINADGFDDMLVKIGTWDEKGPWYAEYNLGGTRFTYGIQFSLGGDD